jgi:hypothetical protein
VPDDELVEGGSVRRVVLCRRGTQPTPILECLVSYDGRSLSFDPRPVASYVRRARISPVFHTPRGMASRRRRAPPDMCAAALGGPAVVDRSAPQQAEGLAGQGGF